MNKGKLLIAGLLGFLLVFGVVLASCDNGATTYEVDDDTGKIIADKPAAPKSGKNDSSIFDDNIPASPGGGGKTYKYEAQEVLTGAALDFAKEQVKGSYEDAGEDWGKMVDKINSAVKGINLPKTDPKDWTDQQISDAYYYGPKVFADDDEGDDEGNEQRAPGPDDDH